MSFLPLDIDNYTNISRYDYENSSYEQPKNLETRVFFNVFPLAQGAVKKVWAPKIHDIKSQSLPRNNYVYYTPVFSIGGGNKKELEEEVDTMVEIAKKVQNRGGSIDHLAVESKVLEQGINGKYTIRVNRADGDLEKKINDSKTTYADRVRLGGHFLLGISNLHRAGFAYGDMKPENNLIYGDTLKVSDFGKTKPIDEGQTLPYKGNTRFAPPEGVLSQKGDVYSAALVLIRTFEEEINKDNKNNAQTSLISVSSENFAEEAKEKLRGVERYVVEHKAVLASNPGISITSLSNRKKMGHLSSEEKIMHQIAIHQYIATLENKLISKGFEGNKINQLCDLLKDMTRSDPKLRIDIHTASAKYQQIFSQNN